MSVFIHFILDCNGVNPEQEKKAHQIRVIHIVVF